jgi:hypothetical protein
MRSLAEQQNMYKCEVMLLALMRAISPRFAVAAILWGRVLEYLSICVFFIAFGVLWWAIFRGVRRYPNLHNHHDDDPDVG